MITSKVSYQGNLRTAMLHLQSNSEVITDAPVDNHGKGEAFSPTDLLATSLASCMMTIMGIKAQSMSIDLTGTYAEVVKHMSSQPRRVSKIEVKMTMNQDFDEKTKTLLEKAALTCPVSQSLHPETKQNITFIYTD